MSLVQRILAADRIFRERSSFVIDSPDITAEKQKDGRVQLHAKAKKAKAAAPPVLLPQIFFIAVENFDAIYAYPATGIPAVPFATIAGPIGVAASRSRVLVTQYGSQDVSAIDPLGTVTGFGTIPPPIPPAPGERYIAIAPSQAAAAGFTPGDVFVTQGAFIYKSSASMGSFSLFATLTGAAIDHTGICFDKVGSFGNKMIATANNGKVWTVDGIGDPVLLATTGYAIEGPAVAHSDFGTYAGQLLVADENNGAIHAIDSSGTVTPDVFDWSGAEGVIPIVGMTGLSGIFVTSEFGAGIAIISWNGSTYDTNFFDNITDALMEGAACVDSDVP